MNKILVTGAAGLLGSSLVLYLKKFGYMVVAHANTTQTDVMFDITDRARTHEILEQIQFDVIFNLVGLINNELCEGQVNLAYLANIHMVENLLNLMQKTNFVGLNIVANRESLSDWVYNLNSNNDMS